MLPTNIFFDNCDLIDFTYMPELVECLEMLVEAALLSVVSLLSDLREGSLKGMIGMLYIWIVKIYYIIILN